MVDRGTGVILDPGTLPVGDYARTYINQNYGTSLVTGLSRLYGTGNGSYLDTPNNPVTLSNSFDTGLTQGTSISLANSDDGTAGNAFTFKTGSVTYNTASTLHGSNAGSVFTSSAKQAVVGWDFPAQNEIYARIYYQRSTINQTTSQALISINGPDGPFVIAEGGTTNVLSVGPKNRSGMTNSSYLTVYNKWYRLEVHAVAGIGLAGSITARLYDGDTMTLLSEVIYSDASKTIPTISSLSYGVESYVTTSSGIYIIDEIGADTTNWIGPYIAPGASSVLGDDLVWYPTSTNTIKTLGDDLVWYPITSASVYDGAVWKDI